MPLFFALFPERNPSFHKNTGKKVSEGETLSRSFFVSKKKKFLAEVNIEKQ